MNRMFVIHLTIPAISFHNSFLILLLSTDIIQRVMYYIDTGHTDMRQLAFDIVKGLDRPGWKDVSSVDEIEISRASGMTRKVFIRL